MTVEGATASRGLIGRIKGILLSPKTEWAIIDVEPATVSSLYTRYVMLLAAIPAIMGLVGVMVIGSMLSGLGGMFGVSVGLSPVWAIMQAIATYAWSLISVFVFALVIDLLATSFGAQKNQIQALKVSAYAITAGCVASVALIIPPLGVLALIAAGAYGCYLVYLGLRQVMKAPESQAVGYTIVVIVVGLIAAAILYLIIMTPLKMAGGAAGGLFGSGMFGSKPAVTVKLPDGTRVNVNEASKAIEDFSRNVEVSARNGEVSINTGASTSADLLQTMIPAALPGGFTRTEISSGGMQGLAMNAEGVYQRGDSRITLSVTDMGGIGAMAGGIAGGVTSNRTTATGYEKMGTVNGRMTTEEYDRSTNSGEYGVLVGKRFMVQANGNGVTIQDLKNAVEAVSFNRLEAMARG